MSDDRYLRHSLIDWFDQDEVSRLSVIIVGAGAVGNEVIKDLALLGVGRFHIVDFDRIEIHNLTRSVLFHDSQVGRYKAEIAALTGTHLNPEAELAYSTADFWDCLSLAEIEKADAVFCCVDNFLARLRLNKLCRIAATDFYNTAIDSRFVAIETYPFSSEPECACYECQLPASVYSRMGERYSCGWLRKRSFQEKKIPTTVLTASLAASAACSGFLHRRFGHGVDEGALPGTSRLFFDTISGHSSVVAIGRNADCPMCSSIRPRRHIFRTKNTITAFPFSYLPVGEEVVISFSDQIVTGARCLVCGSQEDIFERADRLDDSLVVCPDCGSKARDIDFSDHMDIRTLAEKLNGRRLPVKYVVFEENDQQFYLELEDSHE
jgi:molybdopterin-synthase adenylyltransferase